MQEIRPVRAILNQYGPGFGYGSTFHAMGKATGVALRGQCGLMQLGYEVVLENSMSVEW